MTEEPSGLQSMGLQRVGYDSGTNTTYVCMYVCVCMCMSHFAVYLKLT